MWTKYSIYDLMETYSAITIIPNFLLTGISAIIVSCLVNRAYDINSFKTAINDHPDLIIMNELLSDFIELLREKPRSDLPKLFLMCHDTYSEDEKRILNQKINVVDILPLPFDINEFEKKISGYF